MHHSAKSSYSRDSGLFWNDLQLQSRNVHETTLRMGVVPCCCSSSYLPNHTVETTVGESYNRTTRHTEANYLRERFLSLCFVEICCIWFCACAIGDANVISRSMNALKYLSVSLSKREFRTSPVTGSSIPHVRLLWRTSASVLEAACVAVKVVLHITSGDNAELNVREPKMILTG